ncbi:MAG: hypothetical protein HYZ28_04590 [Myxococcales bacterium]|nr:hypothetical protein [Myxococcales bacterium]
MVSYDIRKLQILNDLIAQTLEVLERRAVMGVLPQPFLPVGQLETYGPMAGVGAAFGAPYINPLAVVHSPFGFAPTIPTQAAFPVTPWAFGDGHRTQIGW